MLLATLVPKLIGFRACIPRSLSATISSSSSSESESTTTLNGLGHFQSISMEDAFQMTDRENNIHAAHCLLYTKIVDNDVECLFGLCQVRFDGFMGFPGGIVKEECNGINDVIKGLERELEEEINYSSKPSESLADDTSGFVHISSYTRSVDPSDPILTNRVNVFHFFAKQITEQEFIELETSHFKAIHFPLEALGLFRFPLIDPSNCSDQSVFRYYKKKGGFLANFLKHKFSGCAKNTLIDTLVYLNCVTPDYVAKLEQIIRSS